MLAGYEKGLVIKMKRKWILVGGFLFAITIMLVLLTVYQQARRDKDLLQQETPRDTLTMEEFMNSEEPEKGEKPMIDSKDQQKVEQQEAAMETEGQNLANSFYYEEITLATKDRINGKSYGKDCDIPYEELRYVRVLHWGFDDQPHSGELIVNKAIAEDVIEIFTELYEAKYPIERMVLVDEYDADDNTSMADNNSSAFNYRVIEGTKRISLHSYGMAIDINPLYNPYVHEVDGERVVTPVEGAMYEDRSLDCPYYIRSEDVCYQTFIKRGFTWGGDWKNTKDYQHFQKALPVEASEGNGSDRS
jgi:hypothetical protein